MHVRKSATTQGDRPALAVESFALEKIMSLADDLLALQRAEAERRTREADLAEALNALDANIRTLAEAVGGLRKRFAAAYRHRPLAPAPDRRHGGTT